LTDTTAPVLTVEHVSKSFRRYVALRDVDFKVYAGEFFAIFGRNGAGKTTLLRILATILKPSSGAIYYAGKNILADPATYRRQLGVVSHSPFLYPDLTGRQNLEFYSKLYDIPHPTNHIDQLLVQVNLQDKAHQPVRSYSRGMLQRLSIARALLHNPQVLLFDEPFTGLDRSAENTLDRLLRQNHTGARIAILVTHDLEKGYHHADRLSVLEKGKLIDMGHKADLPFDEFRQTYESYLN